MIKKYFIGSNPYICIMYDETNTRKELGSNTIVTDLKEITVYGMDQGRCNIDPKDPDLRNFHIKNYNKVYKSIHGFNFEQIVSLIKVTNMNMVNDLNIEKEYMQDLCFCYFEYDIGTNTVYPHHDS